MIDYIEAFSDYVRPRTGPNLVQRWGGYRPLEGSRYDWRGPNPTGRALDRVGGAERGRAAASQFCRLLPDPLGYGAPPHYSGPCSDISTYTLEALMKWTEQMLDYR